MTRVFGTRLEPIPCEAPAALLISDLHVPSDGGAALQHLLAALAAVQRERVPLLVLGDLFDTYVSRAQVRTGVWREVAAAFARSAAAGAPVALLPGNRDFLMGAEFVAASGARLSGGGFRGRLGGVDTVLLHGDELCRNDLPYQRAKKWLRLPLVRWLARRLPLRTALAVAERARAKSRQVIAGGDQGRFLPTAEAVDQALDIGANRLVFGHIHLAGHGRTRAGEYWVLPAFDATGVGLWVDTRGANLVQLRPGGDRVVVDEPPPCPFAQGPNRG